MLIRIKEAWFLCTTVLIQELVFTKLVVSHHSQQGTSSWDRFLLAQDAAGILEREREQD